MTPITSKSVANDPAQLNAIAFAVAMTSSQPASTSPSETQRPGSSEQQLLDRYRRSGDREALNQLLALHLDALYSIAVRLAGNSADAEDILQEALLRCVAAAHRFAGDGALRPWLIGFVVNV